LGQLENGPQPAAVLLKRAKADALAERTIRRAKRELGIVAEKHGQNWQWRLPDSESGGLII